MPVVYACIVPSAAPPEEGVVTDALRRIGDELSGYEPELLVYIMPAASGASKVGVFASDRSTTERVIAEARKDALPVDHLLRWTLGDPPIGIDGPAHAYVATCGLDPRRHFEFGRAAARALDPLAERIVVVSTVELSKGNERFDAQYRRTLAAWDVKSIVHIDGSSRRAAREQAVPQTALLLGILGGYRVQPRELAYEPSPSGGYIVAAIDVLGTRRGNRLDTSGQTR